MTDTPTGRGWAYTGAVLGGVVSIAANVAHSYVPPPHAGEAWAPNGGAVIGAIFWPVALFVVIEIFARIAWPEARRWAALRWLGLVPVAVVAAVVSYRHMSGLLAFYGDDGLTAVIGPLAVDGLMVMATGALIATSGQQRQAHDTKPAAAPANPQVTPPVEVPTVTPTDTPPATPPPPAEVTAEAATPPAITRTVKVPAKRTAKPATRAKDNATLVADAHAKWPDETHEFIAGKTGVSVRTVARHRPAKTNGHAVPGLIETN